MKQHQKPTLKQEIVDAINASLSRKIRDAGLRARGQMIAPCSGCEVFTIYRDQPDKGDKKVVLKGDLLRMSFKENFFNWISIWNLSGYQPMLADLYSKYFKASRPGSKFVSYDWVTTESYRADNPKHVEIINGIKATLGLPDLRTSSEILKMAEKVGFKVVEGKGSLVNSLEKPWLERLKKKRSGYRRMYKAMLVLEKLGFVPKSTVDDRKMRLKTVDYLIKGGEAGIFSPMHMTLCRKPGKPQQACKLKTTY